jgi:SAM-dependent methyltransferase
MRPVDRIMARAPVYRLWQAPFARAKFAPVARDNDLRKARDVLDLGCGPGTNARYFPEARYLGLDWNPAYVEYARRHCRGEFAVADVCHEHMTDGRLFDFVLVNSLFHHIADQDARCLMAKVASLLTNGGHVHILDMVVPPESGLARYLATHDRGEHPRRRKPWEEMLCQAFEPLVVEPYQLAAFGVPLWHMLYFKGRARS